jgi:hypothetical protein
MVESFYDKKADCELWDSPSMNEKWTPAEVNQILFRNFKNMHEAMIELFSLERNELYGFTLESSRTT